MSDGCGRLAICAYQEVSPRPGSGCRRAGRVAVYLPACGRHRLGDYDRNRALQGLAAVTRRPRLGPSSCFQSSLNTGCRSATLCVAPERRALLESLRAAPMASVVPSTGRARFLASARSMVSIADQDRVPCRGGAPWDAVQCAVEAQTGLLANGFSRDYRLQVGNGVLDFSWSHNLRAYWAGGLSSWC